MRDVVRGNPPGAESFKAGAKDETGAKRSWDIQVNEQKLNEIQAKLLHYLPAGLVGAALLYLASRIA